MTTWSTTKWCGVPAGGELLADQSSANEPEDRSREPWTRGTGHLHGVMPAHGARNTLVSARTGQVLTSSSVGER